MEPPHPKAILVEALRQQIARLETARRPEQAAPIPSGSGPLDDLLPAGGLRQGTLVEWLAEGDAPRGYPGAASLALRAARAACQDGGALVVLDRAREFYPPAAARLGIDLERLIVVQPTTPADHTWALDQSLRCPAVGAVLAWIDRLDAKTFRRLQLAAEEGGGLGLLIRPLAARHEPSWADVRLLVEPVPTISDQRRAKIHLLRCHGTTEGRSVEVEWDDETHPVHLAARLAKPTPRRRAARA